MMLFFDKKYVSLRNKYRVSKGLISLSKIKKMDFTLDSLRRGSTMHLDRVFYNTEINESWRAIREDIAHFNLPDGTGGVNPGDRRAIYHLICHLKPKSILEVGTHIGASTIHIACAQSFNVNPGNKITTVDIHDVNSELEKPWLNYGAKESPAEMIKSLGFSSVVEFINKNSFDFLKDTSDKFDFIFLDGDHSANTVYQEISAALEVLDKEGVILLHDYFPKNKPLWSNGSVIPGPYLAVDRIKKEGVNVTAIPLGELPWMTKLDSKVTSLALLVRNI